MTPVTIGEQKFIKDFNRGWIDSKTKQPADKGLIRLLDSLVLDEPVLKKLRTKIDRTVEPVMLSGQKFVFDVNQGWIDEKTKVAVPPSLQITLNNAVGRPTVPNVGAAMGMAANAGMQQTKAKASPTQTTGGGTIPLKNVNINKPIVKMIGALASIDGFLKQRLDNQKMIAKNNQMAARESQIENIDQQPDMQVVQPDAERVGGSSAGLLALGGLALLTLDPVQEAIKSVIGGVVETGKFITGVVSTINDAFKFLFSSTATIPEAPTPQGQTTPSTQSSTEPTTTNAQPVIPEEKSSFFTNVAAGAATGAVAGAIVPRIGVVAGAVVGGGIAAVRHVTSGGSTTPVTSGDAQPTSTPQATQSASPAAAPNATSTAQSSQPAAGGQIPKNDIVALGNYLIGKGAERNKMQHSAFGPVGEHSKNSRHYRNMAIDVNFSGPNESAILDTLEPQLRAAGYNTIWRKPGHYTHMHVSVGGPEGAGGGSSMGDSHTLMQVAADTVNFGAEKIGELFGMLGSAIIKPGVPRDKEDYSKAIAAAATQTNAESAVAKTPKPVPTPPIPQPPNINRSDFGATQNPATAADKNSVYYYLRRFGFQELSTPVPALTTS
jgi:hypothetical protein